MSEALVPVAAPSGWAARLRLRNPIFTRELLTTLRQPRGFALLAVTLLVSAAAVLQAWPANPEGIVGQGALSRRIFELFAMAQMLILAFVVPGTLGPSMTSEKERETIDLLLTTPIGGDQIVTGKLLSGLGYFGLLGLASVPVLMLCSVIGGLSGRDVIDLYTVLALQAIAYGLTSIAISGLSRRTVLAVMVAYIVVAFEAAWLVPASGDVGGSLLRTLVIAVPAYLVARSAARRPYNPVPPKPEDLDVHQDAVLVLRHDAFPDKFLLPPKYKGELPDGVNPIYVKELQAGIHGSGSKFVRVLIQLGLVLGLVVFLVAIWQGAASGSWNRGPHNPSHLFLSFAAAFAMTLGPAIGARAFSGEREEGTAEMLTLVLMPRVAIVRGKFLACLRVVFALTAINCVPFLGFAVLTLSWFQAVLLFTLILTVSALSIAVGMLFSLSAPTTIAAMLRSYVVLFVLWIAPALIAYFVLEDDIRDMPIDAFLRILTPFEASNVRFFGGRQMVPIDHLCWLGGHLLLSGLGTFGVLRFCVARFDQYMRVAAER